MGGISRAASGPEQAVRPARPAPLRPLLPGSFRPAAAWLLAACVAVTVILGVLDSRGEPGSLDEIIDRRFKVLLTWFPALVSRLPDLGELGPVTLMTLALILACVATRRWSGAILAAVAEPAATGLTEYVLKPMVGGSFPSGHATSMFGLAAICAVLLASPPGGRVPRVTWLLLTLIALLAAAAVSSAMVAIGAHFFSDAVGGAAVGIGTVLACALTLDALAGLLWRGLAARSQPGG